MLSTLVAASPIIILFLTALVLVIIRLYNRTFKYFWIIAAMGALIAWPISLLLYQYIPQLIQLAIGYPQDIYIISPALYLDEMSWGYLLCITTLVLAVILTDVARASDADWSAWSGSLILSAIGIWAIMSANPLTLAMAWTALDFAELAILLGYILDSRVRERIVISFSVKVMGTMFLIWSGILASTSGPSGLFNEIPSNVGIYVLIAAGLRLGVLPLHQPFLSELPLRRSLGTMLRLVSAAAALILLGRVATIGIDFRYIDLLIALISIAAIYAGISWVSSRNELEGRPYWVLALASFSSIAAIRGQGEASAAWGIVLLLSGGLLFLMSSRNRYILILAFFGLVGLSALPFTPAWAGVYLFTAPFGLWMILLLFVQVSLLIGYVKFTLLPGDQLSGVERWVWVIYPLGLAIIPFTQLIIGLSGNWRLPTNLLDWYGLVPVVFSGLAFLLYKRLSDIALWKRITGSFVPLTQNFFSLNWLYRSIWLVYIGLGRIVRLLSRILEGEGGILWALLLLVLFVTLITQISLGV